MSKQRINIYLDKELVTFGKTVAASKNTSLSSLIEIALRQSLPKVKGVQLTGDPSIMKLEFVSGPTISQMKPNK